MDAREVAVVQRRRVVAQRDTIGGIRHIIPTYAPLNIVFVKDFLIFWFFVSYIR